ncbi:uncharacterized protein LOC122509458 isoform X2 [Leptopilina heterotoma]|uniref:uncharacterized protein LOC122509458 isoform X2 n=1 Tax=Leptopilina heterotoma TaxID=63436 RepID=UPI001CA889B2|nr:uncharacterized protein LOC122509458 isoform X2 [Leptopilina heterotoma]
MSFYNTPLKHGKGINKPFRSPLITGDKNDSTPKRDSTPLRLNPNLNKRSLGFKSPMNSRGFNSPMKPLLLTSPSKDSEVETNNYSSPLKRIENNLPLKRSKHNSLKLQYDDSSLQKSEIKLHLNSCEKDSFVQSTKFIKSTSEKDENSDNNSLRDKNWIIKNEEEEEESSENFEFKKTPPISPKSQQAIIESPEYQPVVKLQRLSPSIVNIYKQDLILLIQRINVKKQEMVELRAKIPRERKISEDYSDEMLIDFFP